MRRKLAENTNTAWGGSLKLETSLSSAVLSYRGNHLVAHAYQVLCQSLGVLGDGSSERTTRVKLPAWRVRRLLPDLILSESRDQARLFLVSPLVYATARQHGRVKVAAC